MPKYQGIDVRITGIIGSSIYEIQDPSKRFNRGEAFTVPMNQVDPNPVQQQQQSSQSVTINGTILLPRL